MSSYPYNPLIPAGPNNPSNDRPLMQTNFASIKSIIGTDHATFGTAVSPASDGMHNKVSLIDQGANPSTVAGVMAIWNNGDVLYYRGQSNGAVTVLGGAQTVSSTGRAQLGGIWFIWGQGNFGAGTTLNILFGAPALSAAPYSIQCTGISPGIPSDGVLTGTASTTGFTAYRIPTGSQQFYWFVVGPV